MSSIECGNWATVSCEEGAVQEQGWKLHISSEVNSAETVLAQALAVLLAEKVCFKVAASRSALRSLNMGEWGQTQVGKFITVYPRDDRQAVRVAAAVHEVTQGGGGPAVPSDCQLRPASLVFYRFGSFRARYMQTPWGELLPCICSPAGELIPDRRALSYSAPSWVIDPFRAAGVATAPPLPKRVVGRRYFLISEIHETLRGSLYSALDIATPEKVVLKHAKYRAAVGTDGRDAVERLKHESLVLGSLPCVTWFPKVYEVVEEDDEDTYLAMQDLEGQTLSLYVRMLLREGRHVPGPLVLAWARDLTRAFRAIHEAGFAYQGLKSTHVIVNQKRQLHLVDFELCQQLGAPGHGCGTRGYMSPQQMERRGAAVTDDIYALGALLYFLVTGAEPSLAPAVRYYLRGHWN